MAFQQEESEGICLINLSLYQSLSESAVFVYLTTFLSSASYFNSQKPKFIFSTIPTPFISFDHKPELLFSIILFKPKFGLSAQFCEGLHTHPKQEKVFSHGRADDAGPVPSLLDNSGSSSRNSSSSPSSTSSSGGVPY